VAPAKYRRVADMLRGQITGGQLPPGTLVPGGAALACETGVLLHQLLPGPENPHRRSYGSRTAARRNDPVRTTVASQSLFAGRTAWIHLLLGAS
jgi:DNA-binding transcriptional MocR family regulator